VPINFFHSEFWPSVTESQLVVKYNNLSTRSLVCSLQHAQEKWTLNSWVNVKLIILALSPALKFENPKMQQVCQLVILQDPTLKNIVICFNLPRICHWKFEEDTLSWRSFDLPMWRIFVKDQSSLCLPPTLLDDHSYHFYMIVKKKL